MIDVQELSKTFQHKTAVDTISFKLKKGETLVLLGTSGSGKTTMLRMINRLIDPDKGTVFIDGKNILDQDAESLRRGVGYVLQNYGLFPHFTVAENIAIVPKLLKWPTVKINQRTDELLTKLQLPPAQYRKKYPDDLSGGQKQRVGLARALAADPPILLMDEPFGALDTLTRMSVRKEFINLDELKKKTIILVTHDVQEAFELGDVIGLMDNGRLEQFGKPAELLFHPANDFVKSFLHPHRLQLELQLITLENLWDDLPATSSTKSTSYNSSQTLWNTLDILMQENTSLPVLNNGTGEVKEINGEDIFNALQKYKTRL